MLIQNLFNNHLYPDNGRRLTGGGAGRLERVVGQHRHTSRGSTLLLPHEEIDAFKHEPNARAI